MKWYKQAYVNHRDWILDNINLLNLSEKEVLIVLLIDFYNTNNKEITIELLSKAMKLSSDEINRIISVLRAKDYLSIYVENKRVVFSLDKLFEINVELEFNVEATNVFETFEYEFKRPLSKPELEKLADLVRYMDENLILLALKEAVINQKVSMAYIDSILRRWQSKNFSVKDIEGGRHFDK